jgi:hypothetical protein
MFLSRRRRGGIGRRAGLKIQWPQGRVGSSPSAGNSVKTGISRGKLAELQQVFLGRRIIIAGLCRVI